MLALPLLLLRPALSQAQQVPQLDSVGRVVGSPLLLAGDSLRVQMEVAPDSLVAEPAGCSSH
ncbi:MAG: hypothetical protein WKG07_16145 [Hymenobacter sp.]